MSGLPTPPVTPDRNTFVNIANNIAENPHTYSLTPLQLLPKRLSYCLQQARLGPQLLVVLDEPEIIKAAPRLRNAMWGIDNDDTTERAEAAAILEAAVCRWLASRVDGEMIARWLSDDEVCTPLLFLSRTTLTCGLETERSGLRSALGH